MIYSLFYEFCLIITRVLGLFVPKIKKFLNSRNRISSDILHFNNSKNNFIIWVHCSSMGEFEQIKPLLKRIKKSKPITEFVITFFSESGFSSAKKFSDAKLITYLPFDRKKQLNHFINKIKPNVSNNSFSNLINSCSIFSLELEIKTAPLITLSFFIGKATYKIKFPFLSTLKILLMFPFNASFISGGVSS